MGNTALPKLLNREVACERLNCSLTTLERLIKRGDLPAAKRGNRVFIPEAALERYLRERLKPMRGVSLQDLGLLPAE